MKQVKDDIENFKKRLKYRLKNEPKKGFALQERVFADGYHLFYNGREFISVGDSKLSNQYFLQDQLHSFVRFKSYQSRLPF